jgi:glucan phosphorylase
MIGITLLNDRGYFKQKISEEGEQMELPANYEFSKLKKLKNIVNVKIGKDNVRVGVWQYNIIGRNNNSVSVYLLDTRIKGNKAQYFNLTGQLYNADHSYRLMQEIILGRAGDTLMKQVLWGCILADFVSIYVAILNNVDPTQVDLIEKFKQKLAA